jgi:thymidine kinase
MKLHLILGPMKSGKSLKLIAYFQKLQKKGSPFSLFQPLKNVRDDNINSRDGISMKAAKIKSLFEIPKSAGTTVGLDEVHMFEPGDYRAVKSLLQESVTVVASGLDKDYRGKTFTIVENLLRLEPERVEYRKSICERCGNREAVYTQIFKDGKPVLKGLPPVVPDDGTYIYKPVCASCFVIAK